MKLGSSVMDNSSVISVFKLMGMLFIFGRLANHVVESKFCYSIHDTEGKCVTFEECPPFLRILKEGSLTPDKLRLLQRLTCRFDKDMPMICCPIKQVVTTDSRDSFETKSQNQLKEGHSSQSTHQSPKIEIGKTSTVLPTFSVPIPDKTTLKSVEPNHVKNRNPSIPDEPTVTTSPVEFVQSYSGHRNFNLIPNLKDCSNSIQSDRIVGGKDAEAFAYPWMARIGYLNLLTNEVEFYCGGTIINKRYILTAAHCTEEIDEDYRPAVIRVGEHDVTKDEDCSPLIGCVKAVDYVIEKAIPHPGYQKDDKANDIELIRVTRDISFETFSVRPICLPFIKDYKIEQAWEKTFRSSKEIKGWVTGWGRTKWNNADGSDVLQEVQLPLISNEHCQFNYSTRVDISEKQMCAGGLKTKDSCGGDSGGPLMVPLQVNSEGKFFQLGVVSFGPVRCGVNGLPGVYSRITKYLEWILDSVKP